MKTTISQQDQKKFDKRYWLRMINSLSGFKSVNLIGTASQQGITNLSIVSSVFHLGANPPLMGFIVRPHSDKSPRHTLINLKQLEVYTINMVTEDLYKKAHQTSARYEEDISEFKACGFHEEYINNFKAPYVKDSPLQVGLKLKEVVDISHNNTHIVIGEIKEFHLNRQAIQPDGYIDIEQLGAVCVSGLDRYHKTHALSRLNYAKPDQPVYEIPLEGES